MDPSIFDEIQQTLNEKNDLAKAIRKETKRALQCSAEMSAIMDELYSAEGLKKIPELCLKVREQFPIIKECYKKIGDLVPECEFFKYHDIWKICTSRIAHWVTLVVYLETGKLCLKDEFADIIGVKSHPSAGFHVPVENYLFGTLDLISDLVRLAVISFSNHDQERAIEIYCFIKTYNRAFSHLNLKNDGLRKRSDALKYQVKRIDEIMNDLALLKYKKCSSAESATLTASRKTE